jgi:hypothetical protein
VAGSCSLTFVGYYDALRLLADRGSQLITSQPACQPVCLYVLIDGVVVFVACVVCVLLMCAYSRSKTTLPVTAPPRVVACER